MDWRLLASAFGLVFLAELGDKTQLAVMMLSAESESPWTVFFGAGGALLASTLLAVLFGTALTRVVPEEYLRIGAGLLFLVLGALILIER